MPTLDKFTLDNFELSAPDLANYQFTSPTINGGSSVFSGNTAGTVFYTFATFPVGTKLISLVTTSTNEYVPRIRIGSGSGIDAILALRDSNGVLWQVGNRVYGSATNEGITNFLHAQIDLVSGQNVCSCVTSNGMYYANSSVAWTVVQNSKPTAFNVNGPLSLVVALRAAATSSGQVDYFMQNTRLISV
ncbi:hypothetical protein [Paenibacillus sp. OK003]|uniref:hypothetical protein n=1 Tax=Paenibacillus sp. OK003 TaxID=1884380 RepID=UPI0008CAAAB2|nr:hypothetical protein [Paenibacillus sp. OK003]SEL04233.1 hypothetical protein SAMN05518856_10751 [Paenibacillus sp. OK003]